MKGNPEVLRYLNLALKNEDVLESAEQHVEWLETPLALVERVGLQNYEQSQMGSAG